MFETDLHSHTLFSPCGLHTILEMLNAAKDNGLKGLAITDHGKFAGGRTTSVFFERLKQPVPGIRLFKGVEANIINRDGDTDVVKNYLRWTDLVLLGYHHLPLENLSRGDLTDLMIKSIECNPFVDMISHPNMPPYPMDVVPLVKVARRKGIALELNNSKLFLGRGDKSDFVHLIEVCAKESCLVAVNSDAHTVEEPGRTGMMEELLKEMHFPLDLVVNRTLESTEQWISKRRKGKLLYDRAEGCTKTI